MAHKYGSAYRRQRADLLADDPPCVWCGAKATTADHVPPLAAFPPGQWEGRLLASCEKCNKGNRAKGVPYVRPTFVPRRRRVWR